MIAIIIMLLIMGFIMLSMVMSRRSHNPDGPACDDGMVDLDTTNKHWATLRPDANTTGVVPGFFVQRSTLVPANQFESAENGSVTLLGVTNDYQIQLASGAWDFSRALNITREGLVRVFAGEALPSDIFVASDATSRARPWVALDGALAIAGRTQSQCTAAGEWVEVRLEIGG